MGRSRTGTGRDTLHLLSPAARAALRQEAARTPRPEPGPAGPRGAYAAGRRFWNRPVVPLAAATDRLVRLAGGSLPVRVYRPQGGVALPAVLYLHGGGFCLGSLDSHDRVMRLLARHSGLAVVGIDYPLAPEARFPVAVELLTGLLAEFARVAPELGVTETMPALAGDSAGAHLALAAALEAARRGLPPPPALLLYYGLFARQPPPSRTRLSSPSSGLTPRSIAGFEAVYLGRREHRRDRRFDLLARDLSGLPPTLVAAAGVDPLLDDSRFLARRAPAASLRVHPCVPHGFLHWNRTLAEARRAIREGAQFLKRRLGPTLSGEASGPGDAQNDEAGGRDHRPGDRLVQQQPGER